MDETRGARGPVLVPLDGSERGEGALEIAGMLARVTGGPIRLLHVAPTPRAIVQDGQVVAFEDQEAERARGEAEDYLYEAARRLAGLSVEHSVRFGDPAAEIVAEARDCGASTIAMATHGRGGVARVLMGSVAEAVLRTAPCPVVTVTSPVAERRAAGPSADEALARPAAVPAGRRCLACGGPSPAAFCPACEARIRGEALEHKRGEERGGRTGRAG